MKCHETNKDINPIAWSHIDFGANSIAYGTCRFNAAFTRISNNPYSELNQPNS
jgi:hypothetical protein